MNAPIWQEAASRRLAEGDLTGAAEVLLRGVGPEVHGFLRATLRDDTRAEDAFSMFCEDVWRGLAGYRGDASLRTWSYCLARHAAARLRRDAYARRTVHGADDAMGRVIFELRSRTAEWRRTAAEDRFRSFREALDVVDQELLVLRIDRRMEWDEIARVMLDGEEDAADKAAVARKSAALRKRYERIVERIRRLRDAGG